MQVTQTIKESYSWGYEFGKAGYQPSVLTTHTPETKAYVVGYIDGLFGEDYSPKTALDAPAPENIPDF